MTFITNTTLTTINEYRVGVKGGNMRNATVIPLIGTDSMGMVDIASRSKYPIFSLSRCDFCSNGFYICLMSLGDLSCCPPRQNATNGRAFVSWFWFSGEDLRNAVHSVFVKVIPCIFFSRLRC